MSAASIPERLFPKHSIPTLEPTKIAISIRSLYFWLEESFFPQHSTRSIKTRHQQLH